MPKVYEQYSNRGKTDKKSPRQQALGDLLRNAREEMGWTREQLSKATGIGTSSIVRYELVGKEEDGQYPKAPALAKLCLALKVDPLQAMLACLPPQDFGMYETLANSQVWKYNNAQYFWIEKQLETVTKDLMLMRSFLEHFMPYLKKENLPEELHWLIERGEIEFDRISDLEARLLQMGVFILPMGSFIAPTGVTDDDNLNDFFDFAKPGVFERKNGQYIASVVNRTLSSYAERFIQLAYQFENLEDLRPEHDDFVYRITCGRYGKPLPQSEKSPEDDLPSPPSPEIDET